MKNLFAVLLSVGLSSSAFAATEQFKACASYNSDYKVEFVNKDEKLIDATIHFLTEAGQPTSVTFNTQVTGGVAITKAEITADVSKFLTQYGVENAESGMSYAAVGEQTQFIFDVLNQKGGGKAVLITLEGKTIFIGSSLNCK